MTKTYRSRHKKSVYGLYMYIHVSSYIDVYIIFPISLFKDLTHIVIVFH